MNRLAGFECRGYNEERDGCKAGDGAERIGAVLAHI
jgi:hypothetical protein